MSHPMIEPQYPEAFPLIASQVLIGVVRGESYEKACVLHAGWSVLGYAFSRFLPEEHPPAMRCGEGDFCAFLERAAQSNDAGMRAIPWSVVIPFILNLVEQYLKDKKK